MVLNFYLTHLKVVIVDLAFLMRIYTYILQLLFLNTDLKKTLRRVSELKNNIIKAFIL